MTEGPHDKKTEHKVLSQKHVTGHLKCTTGGRTAVTGWEGADWIHVVQSETSGKALGRSVTNLQVP